MGNIARRQRQDQGPWTLRGQGLGLWPKVVNGPGFEDEEEIEVVRADRGAVEALREARTLLREDGTENGVDRRFIAGYEKLEAALRLLGGQ